ITNEAIRAIHQACSGTPRLINQMMTAAIDCAASLNQSIIDNKIVDRAWATLQQLPSPMMDEPTIAEPSSEASNVEFGSLDDSMWNESSSDNQPATASFEFEDANGQDDADLGRRWNDQPLPAEIETPATAEVTQCETQACSTSECSDQACQTTGQCQNEKAESEQQEVAVVDSSEQMIDEQLVCEEATAQCEASGSDIEFGSLSIDCQTYEGDYEMVSDVIGSALAADLPEAADTDEVVETPVAATPTADQLFGEFDDEEEIKPTADSLAASAESVADNDEVASDLETSLHEEILSMRGAANSPLALVSDEANCSDEICEEDDMGAMQNQSAMAASAPVLWMEEDGEDIAVNQDDRDMLVIEDDVQVETAALHHESADVSAGRPVAVDFQAMLAKMRSPQS
ncbi:MAG: AAA family ATPase, partial [Rhodopirellula bahusiensis]